MCNKIISNKIKYVNDEELKKIFLQILIEHEPFYFEYRKLVTVNQWKLLIALANKQGISQVTSSGFINKYGLSNASTIRRGIIALLTKELIYEKENKYFVYDGFFSNWLNWKFPS